MDNKISWSGDELNCEHASPACQACLNNYIIALIHGSKEIMLQHVRQAIEWIGEAHRDLQLLDCLRMIETETMAIHELILKALRHDEGFKGALRQVRDICETDSGAMDHRQYPFSWFQKRDTF